jgi:hypothetical protein
VVIDGVRVVKAAIASASWASTWRYAGGGAAPVEVIETVREKFSCRDCKQISKLTLRISRFLRRQFRWEGVSSKIYKFGLGMRVRSAKYFP